MMDLPLRDRTYAGHLLAEALKLYEESPDLLVLALPRGGVPVGFEVARTLGAELDLMLVRKLGAPHREELAMGAIASGGTRVLNCDVVQILEIDEDTIDRVAAREKAELDRREERYRGGRPRPQVKGRDVILIDDGLATGATMRAAVKALRHGDPARVVVAVPVAPRDTVESLRRDADDVVVLATPEPFHAIGQWYSDFGQVSDDEVKSLLAQAWHGSQPDPPEGTAGTAANRH